MIANEQDWQAIENKPEPSSPLSFVSKGPRIDPSCSFSNGCKHWNRSRAVVTRAGPLVADPRGSRRSHCLKMETRWIRLALFVRLLRCTMSWKLTTLGSSVSSFPCKVTVSSVAVNAASMAIFSDAVCGTQAGAAGESVSSTRAIHKIL